MVFAFAQWLISAQFKWEESETLALSNFSKLHILLPGLNRGKITGRLRFKKKGGWVGEIEGNSSSEQGRIHTQRTESGIITAVPREPSGSVSYRVAHPERDGNYFVVPEASFV